MVQRPMAGHWIPRRFSPRKLFPAQKGDDGVRIANCDIYTGDDSIVLKSADLPADAVKVEP
jgi:hypothetical protein